MVGSATRQNIRLAYTPSFWDPAKATARYSPDIAAATREGIRYAVKNHLQSAHALMKKGVAHAAMFTDLQEDFRDKDFGCSRLPVSGTNEVVLRMAARLINGTVEDYFTGVVYSLDGHPSQHISFDTYWVDQHGEPLDLSKHGGAAILTLADEPKAVFKVMAFGAKGPYDVGYYQARFDTKDSVAYWKHLQATDQGPIWVFVPHCQLGTDGVNLHPLLAEAIAFFAGARAAQPMIIGKGHISGTDWFGPLCPCRPNPNHPQGGFQTEIVDFFKLFDTVEFSGVAEDFCDYNMKRQTLEKLAGTEYVKKLRFVKDGTAPIIPNAQHVIDLNARALREGVKYIESNTPFTQSV